MLDTPDKIFGSLFVDLQLSHIVEDDKIVSDAIPLKDPKEILLQYAIQKKRKGFDIKTFFEDHFKLSKSNSVEFVSDTSVKIEDHIKKLWDLLYREAHIEEVKGSSLIHLRYPYIVPGGRFNEIYYWDSYFTMLGLRVHQKYELIESMLNNFADMIRSFGYIPNGNRSYFLSRSQPPFFSLMVELFAKIKGKKVFVEYLPELEKEYHFWMAKSSKVSFQNKALEHCVFLDKEKILNRYYDQKNTPRIEMYARDLEMISKSNSKRSKEEIFANLRAACESGWDFSSRWLKDPFRLESIVTTEILPVDLNCLLFKLEETISEAWEHQGDKEKGKKYKKIAQNRKKLITSFFWKKDFFYDYNFVENKHTNIKSLAGIFPLFFELATESQAQSCARVLEKEFLKEGGLVTTTLNTGQQWDSPNGWAPLHYMAIKGLEKYGYDELATLIQKRWVSLNKKVYKQTGKLLEKYNVVDVSLLSGGGEYPVQDGFGWTNGVLIKLINDFSNRKKNVYKNSKLA